MALKRKNSVSLWSDIAANLDDDPSNQQFAFEMARLLSELPPEEKCVVKRKIARLLTLAELDGSLMSLPDDLLSKLFLHFKSVTDRTRLAALSCRMRAVAQLFQRRQYQSVEVHWYSCDDLSNTLMPTESESLSSTSSTPEPIGHRSEFVIYTGNGSVIMRLAPEDLLRTSSALIWLFNVCRPTNVHLRIRWIRPEDMEDHNEQTDRLNSLVTTLRKECAPSSVKRLQLYVDPISEMPDLKLIEWLPTAITHLSLNMTQLLEKKQFVAAITKYLKDCANLEVLAVAYEISSDTDFVRHQCLMDGVVDKQMLRAFRLPEEDQGGTRQLLTHSASRSLTHFCCHSVSLHSLVLVRLKFHQQPLTTITSLCCVEPMSFDIDYKVLLSHFPNCQRIEFRRMMKEDVSALCNAHRLLYGDDKEKQLRVIVGHLASDGLRTDVMERRGGVVIERQIQGDSFDIGRCCAVLRQFQ